MKPTCTATALLDDVGASPQTLIQSLLRIMRTPLCGKPVTHLDKQANRLLCTKHAEIIRAALQDPSTVGNLLTKRVFTKDEAEKIVVELQ